MASKVLTLSVVLKAVNLLSGPVGNAVRALEDVDRVSRQTKGLRQMAQDLDAVGGKMQQLGGYAIAGGAALGAGVIVSARAFAELDEAMAKVATVITPATGTVADAMQRVKAAGLDWSRSHKESAAQFVDTSYMMISAGLGEAAAIEATRTAMTVATATMGDHTRAAALVATLYNNVGDKARPVGAEMQRLGDIVTATQQTFQFADLAQLEEGLKYGVPTALQYGVALEQVTGAIGALNNAGLVGSQAGTAFTATLAKMQTASKALGFQIARTKDGGVDLFATLRAMEAKFGSISDLTPALQQKFQDEFGLEGVRSIALLMGKMDELEPLFQKITDSAGAAAAAQSTIEQAMGKQWQILWKNNLQALQIIVGEGVAPLLNSILPPLRDVLQTLSGFAERHSRIVGLATVGGAALAITLGALVVGLGTFVVFAGAALNATATLISGASALRLGWTGATASLEGGQAILAATGGRMRMLAGRASSVGASLMEVARMQRLTNAIQYRGGFFNLIRFEALRARYAVLANVSALRLWTVAKLQAGGAAATSLLQLSTWTGGLGRAGGLLRSVTMAVRAFSLALLTNPVAWVALAIATAALLIFKYWKPITGFFRGLWRGLLEGLGPVMPMLTAIVKPFAPLIGWISQLVGWLGKLLKPVDDVGGAAESMGVRWGKVIGGILAAVLALPAQMFAAGMNIMGELWRGLKSAASGPIQVVTEVAGKIGGHLIGRSPPPLGPLRALDRVGWMETIAESIRPAPLVTAVRSASAAALVGLAITAPVQTAAAAMPLLAQARPAPLLPPAVEARFRAAAGERVAPASSAGDAGPRVEFQFSPTYQIGAGADLDVVDRIKSLGIVQRDELRRVVNQMVHEAWEQRQRRSIGGAD